MFCSIRGRAAVATMEQMLKQMTAMQNQNKQQQKQQVLQVLQNQRTYKQSQHQSNIGRLFDLRGLGEPPAFPPNWARFDQLLARFDHISWACFDHFRVGCLQMLRGCLFCEVYVGLLYPKVNTSAGSANFGLHLTNFGLDSARR